MNLEQKLAEFEPLFKKLSTTYTPVPRKSQRKPPISHTFSKEEQQDLYHELQVKFIELFYEFDETRGKTFERYIGSKLKWFAHHVGNRLLNEENNLLEFDEEYYIPPQPEDIDFTYEISFEMEEYISRLSPREKQVVHDHYVMGLDLKLVAEKYQMNLTNCYNYRKSGIEKIRAMINENHPD